MQELGGSTDRQTAELANGNIPYHGCHAHFMNGVGLGGQEAVSFLVFWQFESSLVQEFELFQEFIFWGEFHEICKNLGGVHHLCSGTGCGSVIGCNVLQ